MYLKNNLIFEWQFSYCIGVIQFNNWIDIAEKMLIDKLIKQL